MKWPCALLVLALTQLAHSRGLKAPRALDANAVLSKQLEAENEALKKRNAQLEAMMQMARAEVHRMDAAAVAGAKHHRAESCGDEVLKQEIQDLKQKMQAKENEKADLVQTLRRMLAKNATKIFQRQAEKAQERTMAMELRCGEERQALEAQIAEANAKIKEANGKCDDTKEAEQSLQDETGEIRQKMHRMQSEMAKMKAANQDLTSNKAYLLSTMQSLMRENSKLKRGLQKETDMETKVAKELVSTKAQIEKMSKKMPKPDTRKQGKRVLKAQPGLHMHRGATPSEMARLSAINDYIVGSEAPADDVTDQISAVQKQADLVAQGKVDTHLSDWLGFKSQETKAVTHQKAAAAQKKVPESDETEAESILKEAKANLAALESADTESSD